MRSAMREGVVRHNPTQGASLPARDELKRIEDGRDTLKDDHDVRALSTDELAALLLVAPGEHATLFRLLAATGLRISEATALRVGDLTLNGGRPVVVLAEPGCAALSSRRSHATGVGRCR